MPPVKSLEPTPVGAVSSASKATLPGLAWLNFFVGIIRAIKSSFVLFAGSLVFISGCCTPPQENDQQAFESSLTEAQVFMMTLRTLDSGDITKTRQVGFTPVCVDLSSLPSFAEKGCPTAGQRQQMVTVAREALDYMLVHRQELDGRLPSIQACVRGLRKILTGPEDVRRLDELSDYFERQKP